MNTASSTYHTTEIMPTIPISSTIRLYSNESNSTLLNTSNWKLDNIYDEFPLSFIRENLLTLILYLVCALIALTLLIILFAIILFTYRKHCFPSTSSSPIIDHRYRISKNKQTNRVGIQIENIDHNNQNIKPMDTTIRPCFE
jgi:hypothetical protein